MSLLDLEDEDDLDMMGGYWCRAPQRQSDDTRFRASVLHNGTQITPSEQQIKAI